MFLETLKQIFDTFGAQIFVPFIIFIVALFLKVQVKKAFFAALYAGIGLQGFTLLLNAFIPVIMPVVQQMVESTGVKLPVFDIGWQATAVVAYSTEVGMIFLGLGILLQIVLFLARWTNIFQPGDLWNNYSYMVWGSMIYLITDSMALAIGCMIVLNLYSLLFSEMIARRWSTYFNYPNCTIVQLHHVGTVPFGIGMNWILDKLGAGKINLSPSDLQKKLGFLGEPIALGLLLGLFLGIMGNLKELGTLASWGEIATVGVATAAVMAIFPKVSGIFAQAFLPLTEAAKKKGKQGSKSREWYLGVNDAAGYGEAATLISGITLIPIMVLMALILPGNEVLPVVDLIALPFMVQGLVAIMNGNIFKVLVSGTIWFSLGLYLATYTAPIFTQVATEVGVSIPTGVLLITSFGILTKPIAGLIFLAFLSQSWLLIGLVIAIYAVSYFLFKKKKEAFYSYMENMNSRAA
ncbi:PTS galactitol transporter subunit IIC [Brevibacillus humidisoli]|uniref:PTS galactitol transporter subunit IIC n=1 Tax=Brevibacillus humidisoli TaxID=2895522 RepID=UPI001E32EC37|nr:PTS transporter subunit IIC [Brevibacillus humidisoli]UFJ39865.1 PTS galactitol transporter subunit IIC [Brevibacillus humidisoli]